MRRLRHILVGIDTSPRARDALLTAARLAQRARVTVLHVVQTFLAESQWPAFFSLNWADAHHRALAQARELLNHAVAVIDTDAIDLQLEVLAGDPATLLADVADQRRCDLIVVASSSKGELRRRVLGSTSEQILKHAPVPVWIAGLDGFLRPRKVVVGVDFTPEAARLLDAATCAARAEHAGLHVLHVCREPLHDNIVAFVSADQAAQYRHVFLERQQQRLDALCDEVLGSRRPDPLSTEVHAGLPDEGIQDRVCALDADLLVLGRSSRTQPHGLIGQTTHKMILATPGNALIIP